MTLLEFLSTHTYRTVFLGCVIIGLVAGALGVFAYLRKQSMISDVVSHAALPGSLGAFLLAVALFSTDGRDMLWLVLGAMVVGTLAALAANAIARSTVIAIDAAMAIVLTTFFGAGMLMLRVITDGDFPGKAGLSDLLFGNASVLTTGDVWSSAVIGALALVVMGAFWRPFAVRTFDPGLADVIGMPARFVDPLMFGTIAVATVMGLKAVGLVLMVALVITPAAAARQWVRTLHGTVLLAAAFGAMAAGVGAYLSVALGHLPSGPLIVLILGAILVISLLGSPRRSVLMRARARHQARRRLARGLLSGGE